MTDARRILVTNDDGIHSEGLHVLARQIERAGFEVTIAAPSYDASGVSASLGAITAEAPMALKHTAIDGFEGRAFAIDAPPATCVLLAQLGAFDCEFDAVLSGINDGLNTGRSVLHSGTVGAVLAAQNFGLRGLAVSTSRSTPMNWETAAHVAAIVLKAVVDAPSRCALNLNVPGVDHAALKGIRWGALAPFNAIRSEIREKSASHITLAMRPPPSPPAADTDLGLTQQGYAALTSVHAGSEVWSARVQPDNEFDSGVAIPAVTAGDELRPGRTYLQTV